MRQIVDGEMGVSGEARECRKTSKFCDNSPVLTFTVNNRKLTNIRLPNRIIIWNTYKK